MLEVIISTMKRVIDLSRKEQMPLMGKPNYIRSKRVRFAPGNVLGGRPGVNRITGEGQGEGDGSTMDTSTSSRWSWDSSRQSSRHSSLSDTEMPSLLGDEDVDDHVEDFEETIVNIPLVETPNNITPQIETPKVFQRGRDVTVRPAIKEIWEDWSADQKAKDSRSKSYDNRKITSATSIEQRRSKSFKAKREKTTTPKRKLFMTL
nr:MAG: hypothetical protein [Crogonang virus 31]